MRSKFVSVLGREIHYMEWGPESASKCIVMVHGLLRTCRDFDELATHFAPKFRVIVPDVIGRGLSQWSPCPQEEYNVPFYVKLFTEFLDALNIRECGWFGTSMGGLIGYNAAATTLKGRITHLLLNDIGPQLNPVALKRIQQYASAKIEFARLSELDAFFRVAYKPFGPQTEEWFARILQCQSRRLSNGYVTTHYDPNVTLMLHAPMYVGKDPWESFDRIECPVLVVHGKESDLLLDDGVAAMAQRGLRSFQAVDVAGVGHAPVFNVPSQIVIADQFFDPKSKL